MDPDIVETLEVEIADAIAAIMVMILPGSLALLNPALAGIVLWALRHAPLLDRLLVPLPLLLFGNGLPVYLIRYPRFTIQVDERGLRMRSWAGAVEIPWDDILLLTRQDFWFGGGGSGRLTGSTRAARGCRSPMPSKGRATSAVCWRGRRVCPSRRLGRDHEPIASPSRLGDASGGDDMPRQTMCHEVPPCQGPNGGQGVRA
jgi:hypothetical protein